MSPRADWFLRGHELTGVLNDPKKVAERMFRTLPPDARAVIIAFAEFGLSGTVTLSFNEGKIASCKEESHHRMGAA